jgi:hypothetical protein
MINLEESTECVACETPREESGETEEGGPPLGWWCPSCTFINPLSGSSCTICRTARPDDTIAGAGTAVPTSSDVGSPRRSNSDEDSKSDDSDDAMDLTENATIQSSNEVVIRIVGSFNDATSYKARLQGWLRIIEQLDDKSICLLPRDIVKSSENWSFEADTAVLEYINTESSKSFFAKPEAISLTKHYLNYRAASLSRFNMLEIQARIMALKLFNDGMEDIIQILNLGNSDPNSIGAMVRRYSRYIFMTLKQPMLEQSIKATISKSGSAAAMILDNVLAMESRDKKEYDIISSQCCFAQAFRQLKDKEASVYRYVFSGDRVFQITFKGK